MQAKNAKRRARPAAGFSARSKARGKTHAAHTKPRPAPRDDKADSRIRAPGARAIASASRNELRLEPSDKTRASSTRPTVGTGGVRLQKVLADAGIAARRDCEQLIRDGRIQLNGQTVTELPCFIDPERDIVARDGVPIDLSASIVRKRGTAAVQNTYVLINKPKGMITTARDPEGRPTVLQLVPHAIRERERLFPVGRLDADSTGLLLLTNDGDLAYQLTHPKFGVVKEYRVLTTGLAGDEQLQQLKRGLYLLTPDKSGQARAKHATLGEVRVLKRFVDRSRGDRTLLSVRLREGQNREIRRVLARVGLKVRELERVAIGPLRAAELKPGQSKLLGKRDVDKLRAAVLSTD